MTAVNTDTCDICEVTVSNPGLLSDCSNCGVLFHLNPRNDIPGVDCGDVWVGDCDEPVLQFFCNRCLDMIRGTMQSQGFQAPPAGFDPLGAPFGAHAGTIPVSGCAAHASGWPRLPSALLRPPRRPRAGSVAASAASTTPSPQWRRAAAASAPAAARRRRHPLPPRRAPRAAGAASASRSRCSWATGSGGSRRSCPRTRCRCWTSPPRC